MRRGRKALEMLLSESKLEIIVSIVETILTVHDPF